MADERVTQLLDEARRMRYSRRAVLKRAVALGLAIPTVSMAFDAAAADASPGLGRRFGDAPHQNKGTELSFLGISYFVPEAQTFFQKQLEAWGKENNVKISSEYINWPDLQTKLGTSINSGTGADVVQMLDTWPYLYYNSMADLNDLATKIGQAGGGYYDWVKKTVAVNGKYYSIPYGTSTSAFLYRKSYFQQAGADKFPETWEELFTVGKKLKAMGKPLGQALGHSPGDPIAFAYPYMWAYGAMEVKEDGKTVAFNTPQFVDGMKLFIQAWKDAFDDTGLSWDDSVNNSAFLSDQLSATLNGPSIYIIASKPESAGGKPDIAKDTGSADYPKGPAGRFNNLGSRSMAVMNYSDNVEGGKDFLEWWFQPEQFSAWLKAYEGYVVPSMPKFAELPTFTESPILAPWVRVATYARNKGYAGPANREAAEAAAKYIVVDTFAKAIQDGDADGAIKQGAQQLERIYGR